MMCGVLVLAAICLMPAGCARCSGPATGAGNQTPAENKATSIGLGAARQTTFGLKGTASTYVIDENGRFDMRRADGQWEPERGLLTVAVRSEPEDLETRSAHAHLELQLKDKSGPISLENLESVWLSFRDFPYGEGNATMRGANTKAAIKSLNGGRKPGDSITMEIDFDSTKTLRGRVAVQISK